MSYHQVMSYANACRGITPKETTVPSVIVTSNVQEVIIDSVNTNYNVIDSGHNNNNHHHQIKSYADACRGPLWKQPRFELLLKRVKDDHDSNTGNDDFRDEETSLDTINRMTSHDHEFITYYIRSKQEPLIEFYHAWRIGCTTCVQIMMDCKVDAVRELPSIISESNSIHWFDTRPPRSKCLEMIQKHVIRQCITPYFKAFSKLSKHQLYTKDVVRLIIKLVSYLS